MGDTILVELQSLTNKVVTVSCFGGSHAEVVVVEDLGAILVVCSKQELDSARAEGRDPATVGFTRESVLATSESIQ